MDPHRPNEQPDKPVSGRPYMPTPEQYVETLPGGSEPRRRVPKTRPYRPHRNIWGRLVGTVLLLMVLGAIGYVGYIGYNVAKISTKPLQLSGLTTDPAGRVNILVLGIGDPGHEGGKLSDSMMVISVDTKTKKVAQISIPRDLQVKIPGYGYSKINAANAYGGTELAEQVVADTLGIPIHYYVQTDFTGLRQLVDSVGGIDVNVKDRLYDSEYPCDDNQYKSCGLDIEPGPQHMDGTLALQYARCRKGTCGNDFGRAERQQEVLNLVREKVVHWQVLVNPAKLTPVVLAVRSGLQTDMSAVQLLEFGKYWQDAQKNQPVSLVLSTASGGYLIDDPSSSNLLPAGGDFSAIQERVQDIFGTVQPSL
jgi:LCP family protein required for cell wall assembly